MAFLSYVPIWKSKVDSGFTNKYKGEKKYCTVLEKHKSKSVEK